MTGAILLTWFLVVTVALWVVVGAVAVAACLFANQRKIAADEGMESAEGALELT